MPYTTTNLRNNLGVALAEAHHNGAIIGVSKNGKPHAAIVSDQDAALLAVINQLGDPASKAAFKKCLDTLFADGWTLDQLVERVEKAFTPRQSES